MAFSLGGLIGGLIAIYLLSMLWEWALFRRVLRDPVTGKLCSAFAAWGTAGTIAGFGFADGGPFYWGAYQIYLIPTVIVLALAYPQGMRLRVQAEAERATQTKTFR